MMADYAFRSYEERQKMAAPPKIVPWLWSCPSPQSTQSCGVDGMAPGSLTNASNMMQTWHSSEYKRLLSGEAAKQPGHNHHPLFNQPKEDTYMSNNPIVLKSNRLSDECIGTVRLTPEAEKVVRRLRAKTGLPIRRIVSEIIVQAENLIDIENDEDDDDEE